MPFITPDMLDKEPAQASTPSFGGRFITEAELDGPGGSSVQELLGNPTSRGQAARLAGTGQVIKSIPFNFGDEIFGGMGAGYDWLTGKGNTYDQRLEQARNLEEAASKTSPFISGAGEIAANLALPFKSLVGTKTGAVAKTVQAGKEGAKLGALYGFGEGEGSFGNRAESAKDTAILAGLTGGALTVTGQGLVKGSKSLKEAAQALNRKSIGARTSDYAKTANQLQTIELPNGDIQSLTRKTLDDLLDSGALGKSRDPQDLISITRAKSKEISSSIDTIIKENNKPISLSFESAEELLKKGGIPADKIPAYESKLGKVKDILKKKGKNQLDFIQQQKVALGKIWDPNDTAANDFNRAIYNDLQKAIERNAPGVKELNKELQKYKIADKIVERSLAQSENANIATSALQAIRTTGGVAAPIIAGAATGFPVLGTAISAGVYAAQNPSGQKVLAEGLKKTADGSLRAGNLLNKVSDYANPITRSIFSIRDEQRKEQKNTTGSGSNNYLQGQFQNTLMPKHRQGRQEKKEAAVLSKAVSSPSLNSSTLKSGNQGKTDRIFGFLLDSVKKVESNGNPKAVSHSGAKGAYQFMDKTAKAYGLKDPFHEPSARKAAAALIQDEMEALGSLPLALAAYNAGRPAVNKAIKKAGTKNWAQVSKYLPLETRKYVPKIEAVFERLVKNA